MRYLIVLFIILFSSSVFAKDYARGIMTPLASERLSQIIYLKDRCKKVRIVEWRQTPGNIGTAPSQKSIKILNNACNFAVSNFGEFIYKRHSNYSIASRPGFDVSVSLIPFRGKYGRAPRNLNDVRFRFAYRPISYTNGRVDPIWGFFQRSQDWIYVRNDVLRSDLTKNAITEKVFIHEIFHALSYHYGIYHQHYGNKDAIEEQMAREFTMYTLGVE